MENLVVIRKCNSTNLAIAKIEEYKVTNSIFLLIKCGPNLRQTISYSKLQVHYGIQVHLLLTTSLDFLTLRSQINVNYV